MRDGWDVGVPRCWSDLFNSMRSPHLPVGTELLDPLAVLDRLSAWSLLPAAIGAFLVSVCVMDHILATCLSSMLCYFSPCFLDLIFAILTHIGAIYGSAWVRKVLVA